VASLYGESSGALGRDLVCGVVRISGEAP
jgi:hypothetical protein